MERLKHCRNFADKGQGFNFYNFVRKSVINGPQLILVYALRLTVLNKFRLKMNVICLIFLCSCKFITVGSTCSDAESNLVVPVTYTVGENHLSNHIPPTLSEYVTSGFMQFRAKRPTGVYHAFCPAFRYTVGFFFKDKVFYQ